LTLASIDLDCFCNKLLDLAGLNRERREADEKRENGGGRSSIHEGRTQQLAFLRPGQ
jgi:hypothetical protein